MRAWRAFVEQLQLRNAGAGEVIQHNSGFGIPVPIPPDTLQSHCGGCNDVPGVLSGCKQFFRSHVAVVRLFNGERRRFDENGNMPAILVLFTQFFRGPLCVLTNSLAERIVLRDFLSKTAAADNLLFRWWGFLKRHAAFPVQFAYCSLENDGEIFPDEGQVRQGQIERGPDTQYMELACNTVSHAPDLFDRLQ
ncbi:hypothetical protein DR88_5052 [Klebsiella pneumoniae]|nr:hypothetical protein DR88_5052 [Klebsiella pneumoniae]